ncbi:death domain-containing protein 1 isoform X1 [Myxocyprinus asiaticus]|uniref:death domain-containing protein 1 isoform X1 n=1 Tax=Myxocyprinus asiaticus TaxID=70543 RepID=UPI002221EFDB|nr:death domain-containing protein 1 isoform X1 [Myxocyprinus asiaticus]
MYCNLACTLPDRESKEQTADVDASYGSCFFQDHVTDVILNVLEDVHIIVNQVCVMSSRLDTGIAFVNEVMGGSLPTQNRVERNGQLDPISIGPLDTTDQIKTGVCDISAPRCQSTDQHLHLAKVHSSDFPTGPTSDPMKHCTVCMDDRQTSEETRDVRLHSVHQEETEEDSLYEAIVSDCKECLSLNSDEKELKGEGKEKSRDESEKLKHGLVTVGLADQSGGASFSESPRVCYITAPCEVANVMTCEVVDGLSSLMVSGSEELVSSVLRISNFSDIKCPFPLSIAVPFRVSYRGNYREITVKVVDLEKRVSYVTPTCTKGFYGGERVCNKMNLLKNYLCNFCYLKPNTEVIIDFSNVTWFMSFIIIVSLYMIWICLCLASIMSLYASSLKGSFAVVRVYSLGVFAVLSRLRMESFTVPKVGLSLKLSVDSRICLDYLPGSFAVPVVAQVMVQPVDAAILSSLKSKNDSYHAALTSTPLLYIIHPSKLKLRRPFTLILPCPSISRRDDTDRPIPVPGNLSYQQIRVDSASVKSPKDCKEQLALLGWTENHWKVLDKVSVRNLQNGLVSFELSESYERLIVLRIQSSVKSSYLTSFVEELEEAVKIFSVTTVVHHERLDPSSVVVATLTSRDLSWELSELQALDYCGPPEPSSKISMREGQQLLLMFSGNITCSAILSKSCNQGTDSHLITFHNQRRNRLYLRLKEVDPFGNYSSPHYKGVASLFRVTKGHLVWNGDTVALSKDCPLEEPVCRLPLTLPKSARTIFRPVSANILQHSEPDPLSDELLSWLCDELTEDDAALLAMSLSLRRSAVQIARLRAPHSLSQQAFRILTAWKRGLPSTSSKCSMLAHCLTRSGRPDLARELLLREAADKK